MGAVSDLIDAIKSGKKVAPKRCPVCDGPLRITFYGHPTSEMEDFLYRNHKYIIYEGCECYGDERDPMYKCARCRKQFSQNLEQVKLISCPLEASGAIFEDECRDYERLENKATYELLGDRKFICNKICPIKGEWVQVRKKDGTVLEGKIIRTFLRTYSIPHNHLLLSYKRDSSQREDVNVLISDISDIQAIKSQEAAL